MLSGHIVAMAPYQLVKSDDGILKNVVSTSTTDVALLPSVTTPMSNNELHSLECSEGVLAELHKLIQQGVNKMEVQDQDVNDDGPFDMKSFGCDLVGCMAKAERLLKEEGVVHGGALDLAGDILKQCQEFANDDILVEASLMDLYSKTSELLDIVRPVDLDLLMKLLLAGKQAGDTMEGQDVLLLIGQTG